MADIVGERVPKGSAIVDYDDKVFEDVQAEAGEKVFIDLIPENWTGLFSPGERRTPSPGS